MYIFRNEFWTFETVFSLTICVSLHSWFKKESDGQLEKEISQKMSLVFLIIIFVYRHSEWKCQKFYSE